MTSTTYEMIAVMPGGRTFVGTTAGAPDEQRLCKFGTRHKAAFVIRYWPSRRGWRVLDMRSSESFMKDFSRGPIRLWQGQQYLPKVYETKDQAIMVAIHKLG